MLTPHKVCSIVMAQQRVKKDDMHQHYRPVFPFLTIVILHFKVLRSFADIKIFFYKAGNAARLPPCGDFEAIKGIFIRKTNATLYGVSV